MEMESTALVFFDALLEDALFIHWKFKLKPIGMRALDLSPQTWEFSKQTLNLNNI